MLLRGDEATDATDGNSRACPVNRRRRSESQGASEIKGPADVRCLLSLTLTRRHVAKEHLENQSVNKKLLLLHIIFVPLLLLVFLLLLPFLILLFPLPLTYDLQELRD